MTSDPKSLSRDGALVIRPVKLTKICWLSAALLIAVFAAVGWSLRIGTEGEASFRVSDQVAMTGIGVLMAGIVLAFTRARVVADTQGLRIRGALGDRYIPWTIVRQINLVDGEPWANLDLLDDDRIALFALQSNDGERATEHVLALRRLLAESRRPS